MLRLNDLAIIGFVRKTHGYKGHIKIQIDVPEAGEIETEQLFLLIDGKPVPFFIEEISGTTDLWLVKLEDIDADEKASELVNAKVLVFKTELPELESTVNTDFTGFKIIDNQLGELGLITEQIERPLQDLLLMRFNGEDHYLPLDEDLIENIDDKDRIIYMNLPDGLLSINKQD